MIPPFSFFSSSTLFLSFPLMREKESDSRTKHAFDDEDEDESLEHSVPFVSEHEGVGGNDEDDDSNCEEEEEHDKEDDAKIGVGENPLPPQVCCSSPSNEDGNVFE